MPAGPPVRVGGIVCVRSQRRQECTYEQFMPVRGLGREIRAILPLFQEPPCRSRRLVACLSSIVTGLEIPARKLDGGGVAGLEAVDVFGNNDEAMCARERREDRRSLGSG